FPPLPAASHPSYAMATAIPLSTTLRCNFKSLNWYSSSNSSYSALESSFLSRSSLSRYPMRLPPIVFETDMNEFERARWEKASGQWRAQSTADGIPSHRLGADSTRTFGHAAKSFRIEHLPGV